MTAGSVVRFMLLAVLVFAAGCSKRDSKKHGSATLYPIKGEVIEIQSARKRILIAHGNIPGLMDAMVMPLKVRNLALLSVAQPGDSIEGVLAVSDSGSWLDEMRVTVRPASNEPVLPTNPEDLFPAGVQLPSMALTDQDGIRRTFENYRGKATAVTLVYTRCPIPDFCIRLSNNFAGTQRILNADPSFRNAWQLVTVSFDPEHDTPAVLKQYASAYGADLRSWQFVVGSSEVTTRLAKGFDMLLVRGTTGLINHTLRTAILDRNGRLVKVLKGNSWTPEELAEELKMLAKKQN